ncbi:hypothetical protein SKAU_G00288510 [Synaphobranchus kaupii]|uniref:Uncharacterized protein n=1 Tax=Synaphobranchus kaupii TaxID=118154 RepID=A0A9Q1ETC3_SYNKA|nr:hypothetical protein SKAU_G00288510 [Synaphobranchus kaupii]
MTGYGGSVKGTLKTRRTFARTEVTFTFVPLSGTVEGEALAAAARGDRAPQRKADGSIQAEKEPALRLGAPRPCGVPDGEAGVPSLRVSTRCVRPPSGAVSAKPDWIKQTFSERLCTLETRHISAPESNYAPERLTWLTVCSEVKEYGIFHGCLYLSQKPPSPASPLQAVPF